MRKDQYTTTWHRAQVAYYGNGFIGRYLDAQDREFLRGVAKAGIANSSIPGRDSVLLEELDYWHRPYSVDRTIKRRTGQGIRKFEQEQAAAIVPDADEARRQQQRREDRKVLSEEKRATQQAYRKARRDLIAEREKRLKQTMEADALWYDAHPPYADDDELDAWRPASPRHYVPFWRRAQIEAKEARRKQAEELMEAARRKKQLEAVRQQRQHIEEEQKIWAERRRRSDVAKLGHAARRKREAIRAGHIQAAIIKAERMERDAIRATEATIIQAERARRHKFKQFLNEKEELDHIFENQREPDEEPVF